MAKKSRNPNNTGSRKVMPDGRITYKSMVGKKADGKPLYIQVYQRKGETPSQLKARFDKELEKYEAINSNFEFDSPMYNIVKKGGETTAEIFLKQFIDDFKKPVVKPTTLAYYRNLYNSNIVPYIGKYKLKELKPILLQNLLLELAEQNLSYRTIKGVAQFLKSAFSEAVYNELIEKNPAENLKIPKKSSKKAISAFTKEEQKIFMDAIKGHTHEVFFTMALTTGARVGEMLGLKWDNVDMEKRVIHIRENLTVTYEKGEKCKVYLGTPKSTAGIRTIPISDSLYHLLIKHQKEHEALFGEVEGFVFKTIHNSCYHSQSSISKALKEICRKNNLPVLNLHALRHTFATRGLEAGILPRAMEKLMGHSTWELFFNTYSHVMPDTYTLESEKLVEAINKINSPDE